MPSASKEKRLAQKAAKNVEKGTSTSKTSTSKNTPASSVNGGGGETPMTNLSANVSEEALADAQEQMRKLNMATDRSAVSGASVCRSWDKD